MNSTADASAALFLGPHRPLELVRAPIPTPGPGEVLIRVACAALCSSDLHTHHGRRAEPTPTVLGHEIVGDILAFGDNAPRRDLRGTPLNEGDRVTWTIAASCGQCPNCRDGLEQKCAKLVKYGHEKVDRAMPFRGGFAEVVLLSPGTGIVRLPPDLDVEIATLANCSTATVAAVLRTGFARRPRAGATVVVLGAGVLGLTACAMARSVHNARSVIACDRDAARAERARDFGATHACTDLNALPEIVASASGGIGADVTIELAGSIHTCRAAVAAARIGGTVVLAGATLPTEPLSIEPQTIIRRLLRIEGVHNYVKADLLAALDFLAGPGRQYPFASLIAGRHPLAEIEGAFAEGHAHPGQRVVIQPK